MERIRIVRSWNVETGHEARCEACEDAGNRWEVTAPSSAEVSLACAAHREWHRSETSDRAWAETQEHIRKVGDAICADAASRGLVQAAFDTIVDEVVR